MGAKTALLVYAAGDPVESLRRAREFDPAATRALVAATHPEWEGTASSDGYLSDVCYPPEGRVYAGSFAGVEILCDQDVMDYMPSEFPARYLDAAAGRRVILHAMHSVTDSFAYAIWENGSLVRSLCLSPDDGIVENIGQPLLFEAPYWAGEHPAGGRYPLPFHPLDLGGDAALRALLGFTLEGLPQPGDIDAESVKLTGFLVPPRTRLRRKCSRSSCEPTSAPGTAWDLMESCTKSRRSPYSDRSVPCNHGHWNPHLLRKWFGQVKLQLDPYVPQFEGCARYRGWRP